MRATNRRWTIIGIVTLLVLATVPTALALAPTTAEADSAAPGDGTSSTTAGASCWGIKQQHRSSTDGTYWLMNSSMDRPAEFHCDMSTDGGGWVLVARGRNGWTFNPNGQRTPWAVRTQVDGPAAFAPAALSATTIDELVDHADLSAATDGIRLERSLSANGANRQDYRLFPKGRTWNWNLPAGQLLNRVRINGTNFNGSNTRDTATSTTGQTTNQLNNTRNERRLYTTTASDKAGQAGFGTTVGGGSNSSTNHLWTNRNEGNPLPFTRVWLRPRIANADAGATPIPAQGFAAETKPLDLQSRAEAAPFGVVGYNHTGETVVEPWNTTVMSVKVYGERAFVGGRFTGVQRGANASPVAQGSLAAFDLDGNWIPEFRPRIDGRVWDMGMTGDGKLIIGGDFLSVNGVPGTTGLAALDPATGEVITSWKANLSRNNSTSRAIVRSLVVHGDWVYVAGRFSHLEGGSWNRMAVSSARSVHASDGRPGPWAPIIHGSAVDLKVSADGTKVLMAGFFAAVNSDANHGFHSATDIGTGAPVRGMGPFIPSQGTANSARYQQAVGEAPGGNLLVGGSQHSLQMYTPDRSQLLDAHITRQGGDFQAIEVIDGYVYGACHCYDWTYSGTNSWSSPQNFRAVDPITLVGRWDVETFEYDTTWQAGGTRGFENSGIWDISHDARGCVWVGGDLTRRSWSGNAATDYAGGFLRYCPTDTTAPTAPTDLSATVGATTVELSWSPSTDDGPVTYDIYRDDRVIATVAGTTYTDADVEGADALRYTVRAGDARGNRSASPAPIAVAGPAPRLETPIDFGSDWRHRADGVDLGRDWHAPDHDDASWASGAAPLGWASGETTTIGPDRPITSYFRSDFTIADPSQVALVDLQLMVSQGAVVYVNGVEVGRWNMPNGAVTSRTVAAQWVGGSENLRPKSFTVPRDLLRQGPNSIAVEVHGWRDRSGLVLFDLEATAVGVTGDRTPPSAPTLDARAGANAVELTWTPSTDDVDVAGYLLERDGDPLAVVGPRVTTFTDTGLDPRAPHTYLVRAFDTNANSTASNVVELNTAADPTLVAFGSEWSWWYRADAPADGWHTTGYDDGSWTVGDAGFGFGDARVTTTISDDPAPRPLAAYFRTEVDVDDPAAFETVALDLLNHAGAVVYVNGVEVGRFNMTDGPVGHQSYALPPRPAAERATPTRFEVPASAFTAGVNTIAVQSHLNWRSQPHTYFDLEVTGLP